MYYLKLDYCNDDYEAEKLTQAAETLGHIKLTFLMKVVGLRASYTEHNVSIMHAYLISSHFQSDLFDKNSFEVLSSTFFSFHPNM